MTSAIVIVACALIAATFVMALMSLTASRPKNLGLHNGRLADCPDSSNCVSTQADDREHWIAPLAFSRESPHPIQLIAQIVRRMPRSTIVTQTDEYLHVEFRSQLFRFCDDVEFFVEPGADLVHLRSASRVGRSDFGVNRSRIKVIRKRFEDEVMRAKSPGRTASTARRA